jgi:hypothetical protein
MARLCTEFVPFTSFVEVIMSYEQTALCWCMLCFMEGTIGNCSNAVRDIEAMGGSRKCKLYRSTIQVWHKSVNRKFNKVYCSFNGFYKIISPTEIVQRDLHCYLDI